MRRFLLTGISLAIATISAEIHAAEIVGKVAVMRHVEFRPILNLIKWRQGLQGTLALRGTEQEPGESCGR